MRIKYNNIPVGILPILKQRIDSVSHLFPTWCHELAITYETLNPESAELKVTTEYNYRYVHIQVYDLFLEQEDWKLSLLHEIAHTIVAPYSDLLKVVIGMTIEDNPNKDFVVKMLIDAEERYASDLSYFLNKVIDKTENS
jgi:hypothetical protein